MPFPSLFVTLCFAICIIDGVDGTAPTHCSEEGDKEYYCDYTAMTSSSDRPIDYAGFGTVPQTLKIDVSGFIPYFGDTQMFSTSFANVDETTLDTNRPASLELYCSLGANIFFEENAFDNMTYMQYFKIKDCTTLYVPARAFAGFVFLDSFIIEGGSIDDVDPSAMSGLDVKDLSASIHEMPRNFGSFAIRYAKFVGQTIPPGLLYSWKYLNDAAIVGADVATMTADAFKYSARLKRIDISDNTFTSIPSGMFEGLDMLSEVTMNNIAWTCTCDDAWFVEYAETNNITIRSDLVCGQEGFAVSGKCLHLISLLVYGLAFVAFVLCWVSLGLIICTRKQHAQKGERKTKARGRWNKVLDMKAKGKGKKK
ncbi:uncharacterized protein LOC128246074 [Mya arenaria]|uniref:uncharacterized protein LOC128246074 n=1 Tax=Mya arenaria TaxID=6604 RepID=UPI0022E5A52F|nr:uncharacterized protein LOC128246074 [Mya arenaria]